MGVLASDRSHPSPSRKYIQSIKLGKEIFMLEGKENVAIDW
jgi:hypothetical protein